MTAAALAPHPALLRAWGPLGSAQGLVGRHAPAFNNGYPPLRTGTCWGLAILHLRLLAFARFCPAIGDTLTPAARWALLQRCVNDRLPTDLPGYADVRALSASAAWQPLLKRLATALWARAFFRPGNLAVVPVAGPGTNLRTLDVLERRLATGDRPLLQLQRGVMHQHVTVVWRVERHPDGATRVCMVDSNHHVGGHGPSVFLWVGPDGRVRRDGSGQPGPEGSVESGFSNAPDLGLRPAPRGEDEAAHAARSGGTAWVT